jgi:N-methylhydantoinase A/oxoprolinase/acetone carboxylase beta subunit
VPVIDIHTVGAGGGSIAAIDSGGALRVGPRSAGAQPGPACYGVGTELTVTDANLLLGRLDPAFFFGGRMALDLARATTAAEPLARELGLSVADLAEGVVRVANANMERAIRVVSVERGHDPRDFSLLAFGGAGGMHACEIAEALEMKTVIVPRQAGVLSALGMLVADVTKDYSASVLKRASELTPRDIDARFKPLLTRAATDLTAEGFTGTRAVSTRWIDVRYVGLSHEITLPLHARLSRGIRSRARQDVRVCKRRSRRRGRQPARGRIGPRRQAAAAESAVTVDIETEAGGGAQSQIQRPRASDRHVSVGATRRGRARARTRGDHGGGSDGRHSAGMGVSR